ncbi:MAG: lipopolysaccharide biosynthesis protein [Ignavibacterium sp.]|jgi:O-antigen/teichoic acid export membrane protein|nr:lipopolysaccharide biosynthesis protein [Ignavibacterium sp.]
MKLKHKIVGGVAWNAIGLIIDNGLQLVVKLILARLLVPEVFGIIGFATVFIGMIQVFSDLGMTAALIQRKDKHLTPIDYDTAYWAGLAWSIFLMAILSFVIGPIAANFYNESMLITIMPILSVSLLLRNLRAVHIVNITREMDFKKIVLPKNISRILASLGAILLAFFGFGVWSIVFQSVASEILVAIIYSYVSPWKPQRRFSKKSFKNIFGFGVYTTGTNIFNYLTGNIDYLLIGKLLGAHSLGVYTLGYNITYVVRGQILNVINSVFYPVYSKIQDDLETTKRYYFKVIKYNCIIIYPLMIGILLLAKPLVIYGLGEKWVESIIPMQFMAAAGLVHLLTSSNTVLLRGLGKPKLELIFSIIKTLGVNVPFIVLGVVYNGIIGAAMGLFFAKIVIFFINNYTLRKVAGIKFSEILNNAGNLFLLTILTSSSVFFISNYLVLALIFTLYFIIHIIISLQDLKQLLTLYKNRKTKEVIFET